MRFFILFFFAVNIGVAEPNKVPFPKERLCTVSHYTNGKCEGLKKEYYENGDIHTKSFWKNGELDGVAFKYYLGSKLKAKYIFKQGKFHGPTVDYYQNGKKKEESFYIEDKEQGVRKEYFENGALHTLSHWKEGKQQGETKVFYQNGQAEIITNFFNSRQDGERRTFTREGELEGISHWRGGREHGAAMRYSEGKLAEYSTWREGVLQGAYFSYYPNGRVKEQRLYLDGLENGLRTLYDSDGTLDEVTQYQDDQKHGLSKIYFNGELLYETQWRHGIQHGTDKEYHVEDPWEAYSWEKSYRKGEKYQNMYEKYLRYRLENGLTVYLVPNRDANEIGIQVRVQAGRHEEKRGTLGASHLLEHVLFRSDKLSKDETYLNLFEAKGATVNGETKFLTTDYYAYILPQDGPWLVKQYADMLGDRDIRALDIDTERQTVEVEIGGLSFMKKYLNFDEEKFFKKLYFPRDELDTHYFDIDYTPFTGDEIRSSTKVLSAQTLQDYYDSYYYPGNMTLFIVGRFDVDLIKKTVEESFGKIKEREGKKQRLPEVTLRNEPYFRSWVDSDVKSPTIDAGIKYNDITLKEKILLQVYFEDLAARLMKDLRNREGKTYTVFFQNLVFTPKSGVIGVTLDSTIEKFSDTYKMILKHMNDEVAEKGLTPEDYHRMMNRYWEFHLKGLSDFPENLMETSVQYHENRSIYPVKNSPYEEFFTSYEDFQEILARLFKPENYVTEFFRNYTFFANELQILETVVFLLMMFVFHTFYKHRYSRVGVILDEKLDTVSRYRLKVSLLALAGFVAGILLMWPLQSRLLPSIGLLYSISKWDFYLWDFLVKTPFIAWLTYYAAGIPKKEVVWHTQGLVLIGLRDQRIGEDDARYRYWREKADAAVLSG